MKRVTSSATSRYRREVLGEIVYLLDGFRDSRETLSLPDLTDGSFSRSSGARSCPTTSRATSPTASGPTGTAAARSRFLRTPERGQVSINVSRPGITKETTGT
ncbi:MAG: hypothetical protein ACLU37_02260 [Collinsella sp.]